MSAVRIAAHVYPGWHPIPERDEAFHPGFTEWELLAAAAPQFAGHAQPKVPALGPYDDRDPSAVGARLALARAHGVDAFVYGLFWCRGKRVFEAALDVGFLGSHVGREAPFAVMWANRMPRRVLPVRRPDLPVIDPARLVPTDVDDFVALIAHVARRYFARPNYLTIDGRPYFSIFDSTFFVRELGPVHAAEAITRARRWLAAEGFGDMFLAAVEPNAELIGDVARVGFDCVTHYVFLPDWKGPYLQDYREMALRRAAEWSAFAARSGLPYLPAVSPGWDATPRGADFGAKRPDKYPWWPVVVGERPELFQEALARAVHYSRSAAVGEPVAFIASLNEWSEGHYLEPDVRFGDGWLRAVAAAR